MAYRFRAWTESGRPLGTYLFPDHTMAQEYGRDLLACPEAGAGSTAIHEEPGTAPDALYWKSETPGTLGVLSWVNTEEEEVFDGAVERMLAELDLDPEEYV